MGKADLHAHTCHDRWGDGNQSVEDLFRYVEEHTDLDVFAITDHDSGDAARAGWEIHRRGSYRFHYVPGVEVTNQAGHLLCYFPDGSVPQIPALRPFWWTVRYVQERGGICVAAHAVYPPWLTRVIHRGLADGGRIDGIEAINGGIGTRARERLSVLARQFESKVGLVGNSDAHDQIAVGCAYTSFPGSTVDDFIRALRACQTEPVFVKQPEIESAARAFTRRRSMTHPSWVRNLWHQVTG